MKHSIPVKILAIVLCAASLMGMVGCAAGALVLAQGGLYQRTVDEMLDEKLKTNASIFAEQTALAYAGMVLGGCPEEMTQRYGAYFDCDYGYSILDKDGNVLYEQNPELKKSAEVYRVPVTGQYMHLVSTETESQRLANEAAARMDAISRGMADSDGKTIPEGGIPVNQVIFTNQEGAPIYEAAGDRFSSSSTFYYSSPNNVHSSSYEHGPQNNIGFLYYGADGQLLYQSFLKENESNFPATVVYGVLFMSHDQDGFVYQIDSPDSLGTLFFVNGTVRFTGIPTAEETAAETVAPTTPETIPEETTVVATETINETAETLPEETETAVESTEEEDETQTEDVSQDENETYSEDEENEEASSASSDPDEEYTDENSDSQQDVGDWYEIEEKAEKRILYEWLLSSKLIEEDEVPEDLLSDDLLHYWLVEWKLIDANQTIPTIPPVVEETTSEEAETEEAAPEESVPAATEPVLINGKPLETYQINRTEYTDSNTGEHTTAKFVYLPLPELTVEVYADRASMGNAEIYNILQMVRQYRSMLLPMIGVCLLLFVLSAVYLFIAAGRSPNALEVRAGGLNRLPLDLYLTFDIGLSIGLAAVAFTGVPWLLRSDFTLGCTVAIAAAIICCLLFVGFCFAFVAQVKTGNGFWWRNTLAFRFISLFMQGAEKFRLWMAERGLPGLSRIIKKIWRKIWKLLVWLYEAVEDVTSRTGAKLNRFFSLIPMTWQWLLGGLTIILFALLVNTHHILLILLGILVPMAIVLYATHCFGILYESARSMGKGNLDTKVEDKFMVGCFKNFAEDLNDLADVAGVAAQKHLQSERTKTELITNVSHDIKTPLTSIINYVDLLQQPHTEEEGGVYLEVLDRQSQRLKKLVDDLMDMSKASTGNMTMDITRLDAVESVNQALGEFADKLERAQLYPVFRHSESSAPIMADGRMVWRVLSNLLSNTVKYGMPGTRIYLDLRQVNGKVIISLKNISREELNIDAEELMERFVRGDVSRNTEGSGLGLNIAKSLMELQKGSLQLLVDGDLFKVTLIFPAAD